MELFFREVRPGPEMVSQKASSKSTYKSNKIMVVWNNDKLYNKTPPTPCLWQAPASAQKTKRKTRPATRRSARWRASMVVWKQKKKKCTIKTRPRRAFGKRPPAPRKPKLDGHCLWVLVWTGACYWHGVGGFMFNSSSSAPRKPKGKPGRPFVGARGGGPNDGVESVMMNCPINPPTPCLWPLAFGKRPPAPRKPKGKPGRPFVGTRW